MSRNVSSSTSTGTAASRVRPVNGSSTRTGAMPVVPAPMAYTFMDKDRANSAAAAGVSTPAL